MIRYPLIVPGTHPAAEGIFGEEVFSVTAAVMTFEVKGDKAVMWRANSLPGFTVFNSAWKDWLVHCRSDSSSGYSRLLTRRTILVSLVWDSPETWKTTDAG